MVGGLFVGTFFTALAKNVSSNLASVGIGIAITLNNIAIFIGPLVTGSIMGEKATKETVHECCWILALFAGLGLLASVWLLWTDKLWEEQNMIRFEEDKYEFPEDNNDGKVSEFDGVEKYSLDVVKKVESWEGGVDNSEPGIGKYVLDVQEVDAGARDDKNSDEKYIVER